MTTAIEPVSWGPEQLVAATNQLGSTDKLTGEFAGLLTSGLSKLDAQANQSTTMLSAYAAGERLSPHELVMAMEQAKLSMQMAVEIRNRLIDAYQELTRMQI